MISKYIFISEYEKCSMEKFTPLTDFFTAVKEDARINPIHISIYITLLYRWQESALDNPLCIFSHEVMPFCKVSGPATYHRSIRELHQWGYIKYVPSYNHFLGSLVYIIPIPGSSIEKNSLGNCVLKK